MKKLLSKLYAYASRYDRLSKKKNSYKSNIFTISIGNFHIGGTGKTPVICSILEEFKDCVVVARGYKRNNNTKKIFFTKSDSVFDVGDEAKLVMDRYNNKFLIGKNRKENIINFQKCNHCEMFILDDGFQHHLIERDLDIVLVDLSKYDLEKYYKYNLPVVYSREPVSSLFRCDAIIFTKDNGDEFSNKNRQFIEKKFPNHLFFSSKTSIKYPINIYGEPLDFENTVLLSAIADNKRFYNSVLDFGINIVNHFYFDDHHQYSNDDIKKIEKILSVGKAITTTEKDFVKLKEIINQELLNNLFYTKYDIIVDGLNDFLKDQKSKHKPVH